MTKVSDIITPEDQREHDELAHHGSAGFFGKRAEYLPEFIYGGIDGIVTTFAVVAGATGANLDVSIVLILGFANLFADGFSMSIGSYLSVKSEKETYDKEKSMEYREIEKRPAIEKQEIREIYAKKGFTGDLLEQVVDVIVGDEEIRVNEMMKDELNMMEPDSNPVINGFVTFISFVIVGLFPLLAYIFYYRGWVSGANLFTVAIGVSALAFIGIGRLKSYVNHSNFRKSVGETLMLGLLAALVAYYVGDVLEKLLVG